MEGFLLHEAETPSRVHCRERQVIYLVSAAASAEAVKICSRMFVPRVDLNFAAEYKARPGRVLSVVPRSGLFTQQFATESQPGSLGACLRLSPSLQDYM